jgi:hypothetical protein
VQEQEQGYDVDDDTRKGTQGFWRMDGPRLLYFILLAAHVTHFLSRIVFNTC